MWDALKTWVSGTDLSLTFGLRKAVGFTGGQNYEQNTDGVRLIVWDPRPKFHNGAMFT